MAGADNGIGLIPKVEIPLNIVESPPSLKQNMTASDDDYQPGYSGGTRQCALNQPLFGTVFLHRDHEREMFGDGDDVNNDLLRKYEKIGSWAAFTTSSRSKLKAPLSPMIGARGKGSLFKFT